MLLDLLVKVWNTILAYFPIEISNVWLSDLLMFSVKEMSSQHFDSTQASFSSSPFLVFSRKRCTQSKFWGIWNNYNYEYTQLAFSFIEIFGCCTVQSFSQKSQKTKCKCKNLNKKEILHLHKYLFSLYYLFLSNILHTIVVLYLLFLFSYFFWFVNFSFFSSSLLLSSFWNFKVFSWFFLNLVTRFTVLSFLMY